LSYLHSLPAGPIIHRDIKPANFFLDGRLNAKLGDVGLATPASGPNGTASNSSRSGSIRQGEQDMVGTYAYLPPEYKTSGQLSLKTDVFALGVSLLQLATGQLERLHDLLPRCREAVAAGQAAAVLDDKAGSWDEAAGERLLCLGLWSCSDSSEQRPTAQLLAQELAKLWLATDQMLRSQQQQQQQQQAGSTLSLSQQQQLLPSQLLSQQQPQQQQQQQQHSSGPGGGSFWRFLTNAGSSR
jgi:serine/threonine protein kinase